MAATTITRSTWVDGASGTIINNAALQGDVYAPIDQLFAGGSGYETFTFGGLLATEGFGTVSFTAAGSGTQSVRVRNSQAGTTNNARLSLGTDADAELGLLGAFSSTYTGTAGSPYQPDAVALVAKGDGGLSIGVTYDHNGSTAADIRFYNYGNSDAVKEFARFGSGYNYGGSFQTTDNGSYPSTFGNVWLVVHEAPCLDFYDRDSQADGKFWRFIGKGDGIFAFQSIDDAYTTPVDIWRVDRTGNASHAFTFEQSAFLQDGNAADPGLSWESATETGLYLESGAMKFSVTSIPVISLGKNATDSMPEVKVLDYAGGTGVVAGGHLYVGRNGTGGGAAGCLTLMERGGNQSTLWAEAGNLRINTDPAALRPTEDNTSVSHTSGTIVGTQSSARYSKQVVTTWDRERGQNALNYLLRTPIHDFYYREGFGLQGELFSGIITDEAPTFGMDKADYHHGKSLNVTTWLAYLTGAIWALNDRMDRVERAVFPEK